ncbi:hypothetical protein KUV80_10350 [Fictibacillus nanhaiensis]|uniref:DUF6470 family protein n=1 Tax=Fictibacillus nanhaiensis TaxID=742169 RepID=UPI001C96A192|nr:DUF6470 family protein [Fictibacillus nanhaiensis]MBY6037059.1 hypothetical protein [Fictibacillus nanhaiensis]
MNFPQLRMESTFAQLGLTSQKPIQEIEQPSAELSIKQPKAELTIDRTPGKLTIDQTQAWEDMDLKHIFRRIEEYAQNGYQDWLAGLGRKSQEGDELMRIENGGKPIAEHAKMNSESPQYDFNIGFVPSHFSVKTNYQPANLRIDWKTNKPEIDVKVNKPRHDYTPGVIRGEMKQWPSLKIDVIGLELDEKK